MKNRQSQKSVWSDRPVVHPPTLNHFVNGNENVIVFIASTHTDGQSSCPHSFSEETPAQAKMRGKCRCLSSSSSFSLHSVPGHTRLPPKLGIPLTLKCAIHNPCQEGERRRTVRGSLPVCCPAHEQRLVCCLFFFLPLFSLLSSWAEI